MKVNKSRVSCRTSAKSGARSGAASAISQPRRVISGAITGIDPNVIFGEVASPEARTSLPFSTNIETNRTFGIVQFFLQFAFRESRRQAATAYRHTLHFDIDLCRVECHACISGSRN